MKKTDARGMPVLGAKSPLVITVQQPHAERGIPGDGQRCAIKLAQLEQHPEIKSFTVSRTTAYGIVNGADHWTRWINPPRVYDFLVGFDKDKKGAIAAIPPEGVTFEFRPPTGVRSSEYRSSPRMKDQRKASLIKTKGKPKRGYRLPDPRTLDGVRLGFGWKKRA